MIGAETNVVGAAHPQPGLLPGYHCAEAVPPNVNTVRPPHNEASPKNDRDMKTFLPEDEVRKR
jgi:hypothetical protein